LGGSARAFVVTVALACPALAATPLGTVRFDHLTINEGLSQSSVNALAEDHRGFLWIGTQDGLNRYDGYRFDVYRNRPDDPRSLSSNNVSSIYADRAGNLWIGTSDGTLHRFDRDFEDFDRMRLIAAGIGSTSVATVGSVSALLESTGGTLWVGTKKAGVLWLDRERLELHAVAGPAMDEVNALLEPVPGELWIGAAGSGLTRWRMAGSRLEPIPDDGRPLLDHEVVDLIVTQDGVVWASSNIGQIDRIGTDGTVLGPIRIPRSSGDRPYAIRSMLVDRRGNVWVGLIGGGVIVYSQGGQVLARFVHSPSDPYSLPTDTVYALLEDRAGVVWIGSLAAGLSKTLPGGGGFEHLRNAPDDPTSLSHNMVTEFAEDARGGVWVGSSGGGVSYLDPGSGRLTHYRADPGDPATLTSDRVWGMYLDSAGMLWVGTWGGGLNRLDTRTGQVRRYPSSPGDHGSLPGSAVTAIVGDGQSGIFLGLVDGGLVHFDPLTGYFDSQPLFDPVREREHPVNVSALLHDRHDRLWIGTWSQGICVRITNDEQSDLRCHARDASKARSINDDNIRSFAEDEDGAVWIATANGIARYNDATGDFQRFTSADGLIAGVIYGIVPVGNGVLWVSSNRGLMRYDTLARGGRQYEYRDGLQANEFNGGAALLTRTGYVYFGGVGGITRFHPDQLVDNPVPPKVVITHLSLFNRPLRFGRNRVDALLTRSVPETHQLSLNYDQNSIGFEFAGMHFVSPARNRYEYRLEGFDDAWISTDAVRRYASYSNLDPGEYRFRVRAANSDGVWSTDEATVDVTIMPPWWLTWWARVIFLLAATATLVLIVQWRVRVLRRQTRQLEAEVDRRTAQIVEQIDTISRQARHLDEALESRNRFFARLSHEFRTPITLVLGPIQESLGADLPGTARRMLSTALYNGQRLMHLVDQLLTMAKHGGSQHLERVPTAIGPVARLVTAEFDSAARQKGLELALDVEQDPCVLSNVDALQSILINLISNAIKYTDPGGRVRVAVQSDGDGQAVVRVSDTGIGISRDDRQRIFDLFERGSAIGPGTGIGLTLVKELVESHDGTIEIDSTPGSGTNVIVKLPASSAIPATIPADAEIDIRPFMPSAAPANNVRSGPETDDAPLVLVIDDNTEMRRFMSDLLTPDYRCSEAVDGRDGLARAIDLIPDLILCDVMMPQLDGFAVLRRLRANECTSHVPIIMITARGDDASRLEGLAERADDYIAKPFNPAELRLRVRNLLDLGQVRAERIRQAMLSGSSWSSETGSVEGLSQRDRDFLARLDRILGERFADSNFSAESLARAMYMSHRQLQRKLRALVDTGPAAYIRNFRLQKARLMLEAGLTVTQAAFDCGFSSPGYFARCFRARFDIRPGDVVQP